jgi:hypothetical protein
VLRMMTLESEERPNKSKLYLLRWTCICACTCCTLFLPYPLKRSSEGTECRREVMVHGSNSLRNGGPKCGRGGWQEKRSAMMAKSHQHQQFICSPAVFCCLHTYSCTLAARRTHFSTTWLAFTGYISVAPTHRL